MIGLPPFSAIAQVTINGTEVYTKGTKERPRHFYTVNWGGLTVHPAMNQGDTASVLYTPASDYLPSRFE